MWGSNERAGYLSCGKEVHPVHVSVETSHSFLSHLQEGIGKVPSRVKSVADVILFNSTELPYHKFVTVNLVLNSISSRSFLFEILCFLSQMCFFIPRHPEVIRVTQTSKLFSSTVKNREAHNLSRSLLRYSIWLLHVTSLLRCFGNCCLWTDTGLWILLLELTNQSMKRRWWKSNMLICPLLLKVSSGVMRR